MSIVVVSSSVIKYDYSGRDGRNGFNGGGGGVGAYSPIGGQSGASGGSGTPGEAGQDGKDIDLSIKGMGDEILLKEGFSHQHSLTFGAPNAKVILRSVGGRGGKGGDGGRGGKGGEGTKGSDAMAGYKPAGSGTAGGNGGQGGYGGPGGKGGDGGKIRVAISPEDTDLIFLLAPSEFGGGKGGIGGSGGDGGSGGSGGPGGNGVTWYERQFDGKQAFRSYSSGFSGQDGCAGSGGFKGSDGFEGRSGSFSLLIGPFTYDSLNGLLDVQVLAAKICDVQGNSAGIFEPGERVSLAISATNIGKIPLPSQWIDYHMPFGGSTFSSNRPLLPYETLDLGSISLNIGPMPPNRGDPLSLTETCSFRPVLRRMKKELSLGHYAMRVTYPLHALAIEGAISTTVDESARLMMKIQNISSLSIGDQAQQKRRAFVIFKAARTGEIKPTELKLTSKYPFREVPDGIEINLPCISANGVTNVEVDLKFLKEAQVYAKAQIIGELYLDVLGSGEKERSSDRCIQIRDFAVQLVEQYRPNPRADLLLVIHKNTTLEEVKWWKRFFGELELVSSTWNTSLYGKLDFLERSTASPQSLAHDFKDKTVVIINQKFQITGGSSVTSVAEMVPRGQFFLLAKTYNIGCCILGGDIHNLKIIPDPIEGETRVIKGRAIISSTRSVFDQEVKNLATSLFQDNPLKRYFLSKRYKPSVTAGVFNYELGTVTFCEAPSVTKAHLVACGIFHFDPSSTLDNSNVFGILKILPLDKKIQLSFHASPRHQTLLVNVILSDLLDEIYPFYKEVRVGVWTKDKIKQTLTILSQFLATDWNTYPGITPSGKDTIQHVVLRLKAFATLWPSSLDALFKRRHFHLTEAVKELINELFLKKLECTVKDIEAIEREYLAPLKVDSLEIAWKKLRSSYEGEFFQDNWDPESVVI